MTKSITLPETNSHFPYYVPLLAGVTRCPSQISTLTRLTHLSLDFNKLTGSIPASVSWHHVADVAPLSRTMYLSVNVVTCLVQVVYGILVYMFGRYVCSMLSMNAGRFKIHHKDRDCGNVRNILPSWPSWLGYWHLS